MEVWISFRIQKTQFSSFKIAKTFKGEKCYFTGRVELYMTRSRMELYMTNILLSQRLYGNWGPEISSVSLV